MNNSATRSQILMQNEMRIRKRHQRASQRIKYGRFIYAYPRSIHRLMVSWGDLEIRRVYRVLDKTFYPSTSEEMGLIYDPRLKFIGYCAEDGLIVYHPSKVEWLGVAGEDLDYLDYSLMKSFFVYANHPFC